MRIVRVSARGWRNLQPLELEPSAGFTVLVGPNGQGKTNCLEAIYYLATLRSFRGARAVDLVQYGAAEAELQAEVVRRGLHRHLRVSLGPRRRQAAVDHKAVSSAAAYAGGLNAVVFTPDDLSLPRGSPRARRRFLDRAVFETRPGYLQEVLRYQKLLGHRNALLRSLGDGMRPADRTRPEDELPSGGPRPPWELLEAYEEQLARAGAVIIGERQRVVAELAPRFEETFEEIAHMGTSVVLRYVSSVAAAGDDVAVVGEALHHELRDRRTRDLARGFTSAGPHADDLRLDLGERAARRHASQGQLRALVLALKLSEIKWVAEATGDAPVLLLDDVSSELDPQRKSYLFDFLELIDCQTVITTTHPDQLPLSGKAKLFQVAAGSCRAVA